MGRTAILRPISDLTVNHTGRSGNSDTTINRYNLINDTTPYDGATTYIYDNAQYNATSASNHTSNKISTFKLGFSDSVKPEGKIRLNNITYTTTYTSFTEVAQGSIQSDSIQTALSIDNGNYAYSTTYTRTSSSNTFYTYNHTINIPSSELGKIYSSIDDLNINLMIITNLQYR